MVWEAEILRFWDSEIGMPWRRFARACSFGPNVADLVADFDFSTFYKDICRNMLRHNSYDSPILKFKPVYG